MFFPVLIIIIGLIWLLNGLGLISTSVWSVILPIAVILTGVAMISKKNCWGCNWCCGKSEKKDQIKM